jgi:fructose-bisphosphate aldolase class 1
MTAQGSKPIQLIEIVPILRPEKTVSMHYDKSVVDESSQMLERVFKDLRDRNYKPRKEEHCNQCDFKPECPAWA